MAAGRKPLAPPSDFLGLLPGEVHLAGGGQTPLPRTALNAFESFAANKADGQAGYDRLWQVANQTRAAVAALTRATPDAVVFAGSASDAIDRIIQAIDWCKGDNAVMPALDFESGRAALEKLAARGVSLRRTAPRGWICEEYDIVAACDARTRLVYVSQVNALTGQHMNIAAMTRMLADRDIVILNDASHALGAVPVIADAASVTVASCYKFLHAAPMAVLIAGGALPDAPGAGWHSRGLFGAPAFEYGNVPHLSVCLLGAALGYLDRIGARARTAHLAGCATDIFRLITDCGLSAMTPTEPARRAQNICISDESAPHLATALENNGIRIWQDRGRTRLSAQLFTGQVDLDRLHEALRAYRRN